MIRSTLAVAALLVCTLSANAAVITFNSVPSSGNTLQTSLTTDGFTFTSGHFHTIDNPGGSSFGGNPSSGTIYILEEAGTLGQPITVTKVGGDAFSLIGFDGAKAFLNDAAAASGGFPNATTISLTATLPGGGITTALLNLDGSGNFQPFILPASFGNVLSVTFSGTNAGGSGGISLDNINVGAAITAVPEPATLAIFGGIAVAGLAGYRRRKATPTTAA